jgi:hypothetical protein
VSEELRIVQLVFFAGILGAYSGAITITIARKRGGIRARTMRNAECWHQADAVADFFRAVSPRFASLAR